MNGIISFDRAFPLDAPENFPSRDGDVYYSYLVAPYWSNIDTRRAGSVRYETYRRGDSEASDQQMGLVTDFLGDEEGVDFVGEWMLLASWDGVHPFPHGDSANMTRQDPYLDSVWLCMFIIPHSKSMLNFAIASTTQCLIIPLPHPHVHILIA